MPETNNPLPVPQQELETLADVIRTADRGVAHAAANLIEHALAAGDALLQAKAKVGYGNWLQYLKNKCDLSEDRAERYMRLAHGREVLEADSARVRNLSLAQALRLIDEHKRKSQPRESGGQSDLKPTKAKAVERLNSLAWSNASPAERTQFLDAIGVDAFLSAVPSGWDLKARMFREASLEELWAAVARKTPTRIQQKQIAEKRNSKVTVLGRARRHAGVTLEHEPTTSTITTRVEETTH